MNVLIGLSGNRSLKHSRALALYIKPFLDALVTANQLFLCTHKVPLLYSSGVRYQEEPLGQTEEFAAAWVVLARGWGDCDDLAPWRCAELRNAGERAKIRISWRPAANGGKLFHVVVKRANGEIEDPSRLLGMGR